MKARPKELLLTPDYDTLTIRMCPHCRQDTMVEFGVIAITDTGVGDFGTLDRCVTCRPYERNQG